MTKIYSGIQLSAVSTFANPEKISENVSQAKRTLPPTFRRTHPGGTSSEDIGIVLSLDAYSVHGTLTRTKYYVRILRIVQILTKFYVLNEENLTFYERSMGARQRQSVYYNSKLW